MQPLVHLVEHQLHGMQHLPVGGSQYRPPHRTCCAASTGVKRKREPQLNQLAPAEAKEFLTWATEAGAKADKLELAMFDGAALHDQTASMHHSLRHALHVSKLCAAQLPSASPQLFSKSAAGGQGELDSSSTAVCRGHTAT